MEADTGNKLHVVMLPWLAIGHLLPFFELSKRLALKGHQISFFSTPSNILRLPPIPQTLTPFFHFIPCSPSSAINNVVENTVDLRSEADRPLIGQAYQDLEKHLITFLQDPPSRSKPNWIFYDLPTGKWASTLASLHGINSALFGVLNAPLFSFRQTFHRDSIIQNLTKPPDFTPFPTNVRFRPFEARRIIHLFPTEAESLKQKSRLLILRTFREFDARWIGTLGEQCCPVGFLNSSSSCDEKEEEGEAGARISEWLDKQQKARSVIYASFGSEAILTREQIDEIAIGLETAGLPFVWVLRVGSPPPGFEERTAARGMVWMGWVPQARLLAHSAIGGFLMQGGWNSAVQGMALGLPLVILPLVFEQGLNARHLAETGYAVEVERDDEDGRFDGEEIARKLKMVMVEEEGEELRKKARQGKEVFGSEKFQDEYIVELVKFLWEKRMTFSEPA